MPFIGVIAKENDICFIKNKINENAAVNKFEVIGINKKSIENLKNIKFDILVINENINEFLKESKYIENIMNKTDYIIINSDLKNDILLKKEMNANIITYGFNAKATITISSVADDNIMICIQRKIQNFTKVQIEEQEISIKTKENNSKILYNILIIFTILIIFGKKLKKI